MQPQMQHVVLSSSNSLLLINSHCLEASIFCERVWLVFVTKVHSNALLALYCTWTCQSRT